MTSFSPREIVSELDRHIVGQRDAKRAVAIALRNRWRRQQLDEDMREEVLPKNILMIGPTGVGKTEISRRLAKLAGAPFIKVEATKFTEVGYVGRDVDQIVRDLVEVGIGLVRDAKRKEVAAKAQLNAEERVLDALVGAGAALATREAFRKRLRTGELDDKEIEIQVADTPAMPSFEIPGMPGSQVGMINLSEMLGKAFGQRTKPRKVTVRDSLRHSAERGDRQADRQRHDRAGGDQERREQRHRVSRRDRQDLRALRAHRRRCQPRRRAARPPAADRGHHGRHQVRAGQDRPHPVHRLRRLPHRQAVGPAARAAGPAADPRRAAPADARRFPPHPDRAQGLPHQAICGADEDRGRRARIHRRRHRRHRRHRRRR